ncbi:hypothetical protein PAXRUDRAFT_151343, partial [Paxillus rubicundulus Ve08.2h10]
AVDKVCLIADASSKVPNLKKKYSDYTVSPNEWEMLGLIQEVLNVAIEKGLTKLRKYYTLIDQSNVSVISIVALDPNWKLEYTSMKWDLEYYELGLKALEDTVSTSILSELSCICLNILGSLTNMLLLKLQQVVLPKFQCLHMV